MTHVPLVIVVLCSLMMVVSGQVVHAQENTTAAEAEVAGAS